MIRQIVENHMATIGEAFQIALSHHRSGQLREAAAIYQQILQADPNHFDALHWLGVVAQQAGQTEVAIQTIRRAIELRGDQSAFHYSLAEAYRAAERLPEAIECYRQALRLDPGSFRACNNLAGTLRALGDMDQAVAAYRQTIEMQPTAPGPHSNLLYTLNFMAGSDTPAIFSEHLSWAKQHAEPLTALAPACRNDRTPDRRLRIGYVSPHFRLHAVSYFIEPVLMAHDHGQFEVFCYSDVDTADAITARFKSAADTWRDIQGKSDEQVAQIVRDDQIDILIDLTGHVGGNRLLVFARKPAPVQVTYLGYQNTTGMSAMDYRLTDARADPLGESEPFYTEQLVRLPHGFFCYQPPSEAPPITSLPARTTGHVTFGSFNHFAKVTPRVIATWVQLLKRVQKSRLLLIAPRGGPLERRLYESAQAENIDADRIEWTSKRPLLEYLSLIQRADIALDPFPFNGHTTTCDSIWMGVPVVMLAGSTYASRFGGSVLANVGLEDLIAHTTDEYVDRAAELAADLDRLAPLRSELRRRMADSVLLDFPGFTRNLERSYRQMWQTWCSASPRLQD